MSEQQIEPIQVVKIDYYFMFFMALAVTAVVMAATAVVRTEGRAKDTAALFYDIDNGCWYFRETMTPRLNSAGKPICGVALTPEQKKQPKLELRQEGVN